MKSRSRREVKWRWWWSPENLTIAMVLSVCPPRATKDQSAERYRGWVRFVYSQETLQSDCDEAAIRVDGLEKAGETHFNTIQQNVSKRRDTSSNKVEGRNAARIARYVVYTRWAPSCQHRLCLFVIGNTGVLKGPEVPSPPSSHDNKSQPSFISSDSLCSIYHGLVTLLCIPLCYLPNLELSSRIFCDCLDCLANLEGWYDALAGPRNS